MRNPTSLALPADRAVDRFIKLIQAMMIIKAPMPPKKYTYIILVYAMHPIEAYPEIGPIEGTGNMS